VRWWPRSEVRAEVAAIGITNQRETTLVWDRVTGLPVADAIVWQSRITAPFCEELRRRGVEPLVRARTGLPLDAYFSGPKIRHILDAEPGLRARAEAGELCFGTVDTFLLWRLTGGLVHATDVTNASRTLLFDIHRLGWDEELLALMEVPATVLPAVHATSEVYGETSPDVFGARIPIAALAGDQQAATFGQACQHAGQAKTTYGTGAFLLLTTGGVAIESGHGLVTTVGWQLGRGCAGELRARGLGLRRGCGGAVASRRPARHRPRLRRSKVSPHRCRTPGASSSYRHSLVLELRTGIRMPEERCSASREAPALARSPGPHSNPSASGSGTSSTPWPPTQDQRWTCSGLTAGRPSTTPSSSSRPTFLAFLSSVPASTESTALGAAYFAGLAVGFWKDAAEIERIWRLDRRFEPLMAAGERDDRYERWQRAVTAARAWSHPSTVPA